MNFQMQRNLVSDVKPSVKLLMGFVTGLDARLHGLTFKCKVTEYGPQVLKMLDQTNVRNTAR